MPEVAQNIIDIIKSPQFDWEKMIRASFDRKVEENDAQELLAGREAEEENMNLIDLFTEESLRPELEIIAEKYRGNGRRNQTGRKDTAPICGKEPKIGEIREEEDGKRYLFVISAALSGIFTGSNVHFAATMSSIPWLILKWKAKSVAGWMSAINAVAISKPLNCLNPVKSQISTLRTSPPCIWI